MPRKSQFSMNSCYSTLSDHSWIRARKINHADGLEVTVVDTVVRLVAVVVVVEDADALVVREMIVVETVVVTGTATVCVTEAGELVADEVVVVALQVRSYRRMSSL